MTDEPSHPPAPRRRRRSSTTGLSRPAAIERTVRRSLTSVYPESLLRDLLEMEAGNRPWTDAHWSKRQEILEELGDRYYESLMGLLTPRELEPHRARSLWYRIRAHADELTVALGRNPGVHVAALDYLLNVEKQDQRPVVVQREVLDALRDEATRDPLTGVYDRMSLEGALESMIDTARESGRTLTLIMVDLDGFKSFNDRHGHLEGDRLLVEVAETLNSTARITDLVCRYGGDEFALVAPDTDAAAALAIADRVRDRIERHTHGAITASVGIAAWRSPDQNVAELIAAADGALYESKRLGRNRVSTAP